MLNRNVVNKSITRLLFRYMIPCDGVATLEGQTAHSFHYNNDYYIIAFGKNIDSFCYSCCRMSADGIEIIYRSDGLTFQQVEACVSRALKSKYYDLYKN